jgi:hypothetical protein
MSKPLFTYNDDSELHKMSMKRLLRIPIWKGNRIINQKHLQTIQSSIGVNIKLLDDGFKIVRVPNITDDGEEVIEEYVIDGQHRLKVISNYFNANPDDDDDYPVMVRIYVAESECQIIDIFNKLNNSCPILFDDPKIVANRYLEAVCSQFPSTKSFIPFKPTKCNRPSLNMCELRTRIEENISKIREQTPEEFAAKVVQKNKDLVKLLTKKLDKNPDHTEASIIKKCIEKKFALAFSKSISWFSDLL